MRSGFDTPLSVDECALARHTYLAVPGWKAQADISCRDRGLALGIGLHGATMNGE